MSEADVIVVGAGLAGLAAARLLTAAGRSVIVLESAEAVGGRVRSEVIDGLTLDRGFQLLNPAYPEARRVLDLDALQLRPFIPGVLLTQGDERHLIADPRRRPSALFSAARFTPGTRVEQMRFAAYAAHLASGDGRRIDRGPDSAIGDRLAIFGALSDQVLAPFLAGVLFDDSMTTSRRFAEFLLRSFILGTPALPAMGMQAIPDQLATGLDVRTRTSVVDVSPTSVTTLDGQLRARAVVVATDPATAGRLVPGLAVPTMRSGTTWWHLADMPGAALTGGLPVLVVDPARRGPLVNTVVVSNAAASYLGVLHGVNVDHWETVAVQRISATVPAVPPGTSFRQTPHIGGIFVAGDHRDTASIQGALVSGRRIAHAVLEALAEVRHMATPRILATSGGFTASPHYNARVPGGLFLEALRLSGKDRPRVLFVMTASGDSDMYLTMSYQAVSGLSVDADHLSLFTMPNQPVDEAIGRADVIWVGGGSVANLLTCWRIHGVDLAMRDAWERGTVLAGVSAGSICWHVGGPTDSYGPTLRLEKPALGLIPYGNGVHYDSESQRRPLLQSLVADELLPTSFATDDRVGILYEGTEPVAVLTDYEVDPDTGPAAYRVEKTADGVIETRLTPGRLG